ncbi:alpha/beta fold hydrolase [Lysinibacillus sp. NPDC095746]|uniref:alpha/beta fold hydrolase n=1 Tax=Lysinibacillus sp. NPDC095746 TaxID=3364134 RepID=UPI00380A0E27
MKKESTFSIILEDGHLLNYKIYGNPKNNPIIYLHGFGSSASGLYINENKLDAKNFYVIAINRPGYGSSSLKHYNMTYFSRDIKSLLEKLNLDMVDIIGWSAGGTYAQIFASIYPDCVKSLTLISSAIPLKGKNTKNDLPINWKFISFFNSYFPLMTKYYFKKLSKKINHHIETTVKDSIDKMPEADQSVANQRHFQEVITKAAVEAYQNNGLAVYYDAVAMTEKVSLNYAARPYKIYIWHGEKDNVWPLKTAKTLNKLYTDSSFHIIENKGHLLYLSYFDEIVNEIESDQARLK